METEFSRQVKERFAAGFRTSAGTGRGMARLLVSLLLFFTHFGVSFAQTNSPLPVEAINLRIFYDISLFDVSGGSARDDQLKAFCAIWQDAFLREKGPWGFGIASEVSCRIYDKPSFKPNDFKPAPNVWNLFVEKRTVSERPVVQTNLCRSRVNAKGQDDTFNSESLRRCEATQFFPWSEFRSRLLRHRAFVRLIADSLFDQLPFQSLLSKNLIRFDDLKVEPGKEPNTAEVVFPGVPRNLGYAELSFNPQSLQTSRKEYNVKDAIYQVMSRTGTIWIVNLDGPGSRTEQFSKNVQSAYVALVRIFQVEKLKVEKEQTANVLEKLKSRPFLDLIIRADGMGGLPAMSMVSSTGAALAVGMKYNLKWGVEASYKTSSSIFKTGTEVQEKDNTSTSTNTTEIRLNESDAWVTTRAFTRLPMTKSSLLELGAGGRLGFISADGTFKSDGGLPGQILKLSARELGLGVTLLAGIPLFGKFENVNSATFDFGMTNKSYSIRAHSEFAWILSRLVFPGRADRPPAFRLGAAASFSSLIRPFSSDDAARRIETTATLNAIHAALFLERSF